MQFLLYILSIFIFGCAARPSTSIEDQFHQIQQEVEQLKRTYDAKISTQDEKITRHDDKIASLEQQLQQKVDLIQMESQRQIAKVISSKTIPKSG